MPPAGNGHSLFFVDLNGGREFSIQDMTLRGVALFLIDPQQDCQSCFDDLDERLIVAIEHQVLEQGSFGFRLGDHDPNLSLVDDPHLSWSFFWEEDQEAITRRKPHF